MVYFFLISFFFPFFNVEKRFLGEKKYQDDKLVCFTFTVYTDQDVRACKGHKLKDAIDSFIF